MNFYYLTGEEDAPEEGAGEQADNEPDSEDAAPKGGVIIANLLLIWNCSLFLFSYLLILFE